MRKITDVLGLMISLILFMILFVWAVLICWVPLKQRVWLLSPVYRFVCWGVLRLGCGAQLYYDVRTEKKDLDRHPWGHLTIANHQAMMDIPLVYSKFPIPPILKASLTKVPVFGPFVRMCGGIAVQRGDKDSRDKAFREASRRLANDMSVFIYPEGTRSKTVDPRPFEDIKAAMLLHAYRTNVPVQPISMYGTRYVLNGAKANRGLPLGLIAHQMIHPKDFDDEMDFAKTCWDHVLSGHAELKSKFQNHSKLQEHL